MGRSNRPLQLDRENAKWLGVCAGIANFLEVKPWSVRLVFLGCLIFGGWFLFPLYFISWYLMNDDLGEFKASVMSSELVKHFRNVDYRKKIYRNTRDGKIWGVCAGIADYLEVSVFPVRLFFMLISFLAGFPVMLYVGAAMVLDKKPLEEYQYESRSRSRRSSQFDPGDDADSPRARAAEMAGMGKGSSNAGSANSASSSAASANAGSSNAGSSNKEAPKSRRSERSGFRDQYSQRHEFQFCARKFVTLRQRLARLEAYVTSPRFKLHRDFKTM